MAAIRGWVKVATDADAKQEQIAADHALAMALQSAAKDGDDTEDESDNEWPRLAALLAAGTQKLFDATHPRGF